MKAKGTNIYQKEGNIVVIIDQKGHQSIIDSCYFNEVSNYYWFLGSQGYFVTTHLDKFTSLHQFVIKLRGDTYTPFKQHIDHLNRNKLDNTSNNLSVVSPSLNTLNRGLDHRNSTGFLGVSKYGNKYRGEVNINKKRYRKAGFNTPEEAHQWVQKIKEEILY